MSNVRGEQPLPLDIPEQPTERYRVRQIPGLALWFVLDTAEDEAVTYPTTYRESAQTEADSLNQNS